MRFCFSATFSAPDELVALARAGDEAGWDTLTVSDHLINPVATRRPYPYTADGSRRWGMGTPWPDPWVTIGHLSAVTERLRFLTTVYILPARMPAHVAKQVGTARSEEHTSELQSLMRISYAVFCLKKKKNTHQKTTSQH